MNMSSDKMNVKPDVILKVTKEIVVKFIEMGKVSPASFDETFKGVYRSILEVISDTSDQAKDR